MYVHAAWGSPAWDACMRTPRAVQTTHMQRGTAMQHTCVSVLVPRWARVGIPLALQPDMTQRGAFERGTCRARTP